MPRRILAALLATAAALALAVVPVLAKEGLVARLDAPIPMGTPGGTVLLVGLTVISPDGTVDHPVDGSPIYVKLTGPQGDTTWEMAAGQGSGHYVATIAVPAGGARAIEVGLHGTSDLAILVDGESFAFGGVTAGTAQVAVPSPALTPLPRSAASAAAGAQGAAAAPAAGSAAPAAGSATPAAGTATPASRDGTAWLALGAVLLASAIVLAAFAGRRARGATGRAPGGATGA